MWPLTFISEEDFRNHVIATIEKYGEKLDSYDIKRFNSNIVDPIKLIFDKFLMKNYRFDRSTYTYLNCEDFKCYSDITEYVLKTLEQLY